jgi:hypothetical protein
LEIIPIFAENIWSIQYDNEELDEYSRAFNSWHNIEYLYDFIEDNKKLLDDPFWNTYDIERIVWLIYEEARSWEAVLHQLYKNSQEGQKPDFDDKFFPISKNIYEWRLLRTKAYGKSRDISPSFLRLYAIKVANNAYIITGGAIKLTKTMNECAYLKKELIKLENVRRWLQREGLSDIDDLINFENE